MFKVISLLTLLLMTPTAPIVTQSQREIAVQNFITDPDPKSGTLLLLRLAYIGGGCCVLHDVLEELPGPEGIATLPKRQVGTYYVVEIKQIYRVKQLPLTYETERIDEGP